MKSVFTLLFTSISILSFSQTASIEGYLYETGNRGYINGVNVSVENIATDELIGKSTTDADGFFSIPVPKNTNVRLYATKEMFDVKKLDIKVESGKTFVKLEMGRMPGYTFEVTLAEKRDNENTVVDAIEGARIEVYNNTKRESVMDLKEHMSPEFQLNLAKGNHYTILIRKEGYLSKRMEAKVDVEGCILCFEGVGKVNPGVTDNLTEDNAFGVLLANVELERIFTGKKMEVQNLYYKSGKWNLSSSARKEMKKVITLMKDNPNLTLELGAHTDSQGKAAGNQILSEKRANAAVDYMIMKGDIARARIVSKGYGENILLNDCGDGSNCSKEEHAKNRRTELKIVGITNVAKIKSLKRMKEEEHMEEEILGLMDQKEVRAESVEDLQNRLQEEATKTKSIEKKEITQESTFMEKKKDAISKVKKPTANKTVEKTIEKKVEIVEEKAEIIEEKVNKKVEEKAIAKVTETTILEKVEEKTTTEEVIEKVEKETILPAKTKSVKKDFDDMPGLEVVEKIETSAKKAGESKIVLYRSSEPLMESNPMFKQHKNVEVFRDTDRTFNYMIGDFKSESDAKTFYNTYIKSQYKESFLANIVDGKMIKK